MLVIQSVEGLGGDCDYVIDNPHVKNSHFRTGVKCNADSSL